MCTRAHRNCCPSPMDELGRAIRTVDHHRCVCVGVACGCRVKVLRLNSVHLIGRQACLHDLRASGRPSSPPMFAFEFAITRVSSSGGPEGHPRLIPTRLWFRRRLMCPHSLRRPQTRPRLYQTGRLLIRVRADTHAGAKLLERRPISLVLSFVKTLRGEGPQTDCRTHTSLGYSGTIATVRNKPANHAKRQDRRSSNDGAPVHAHTVVCVTYDGLAPFEFSVAYEVFGKPGDYLPKPWYRFVVCASRPGPVKLSSGLSLDIPLGLRALARADTVIVPPSRFPDSVPEDVLIAIRRAHRRGARIVSLCTGAFVVAAAGLLDGRRATTHWMFTDELASRYPAIIVDPAVLYVDEGDVLTSAGVASCIDLCLHVVRHDWGAEVANNLSRYMVVPSHRDGGQAQFISAPMLTTTPSNQPLGATLDWAA